MTDTADAAQPSPEQEPPPSVRRHRGDIMSPETRSRVMSRIRGRDTGPELVVATGLAALGLPYESHARDLPGRPDFVLRNIKLAIFVDGDFWHGYRFADWRDKLSPAWELKIARNRRRDTRNFRLLRSQGWKVVRLWEHQLERSAKACLRRISKIVAERTSRAPGLGTSLELTRFGGRFVA
jgi:DNA mismatch endonuclease, patch repair protein